MQVHIDHNIGVSGYRIHWMRSSDGKEYWCRTAIAIMGSFNMPDEYLRKTSPFDPGFQDNYVEGRGSTKEEALAAMQKEMEELTDSLWY